MRTITDSVRFGEGRGARTSYDQCSKNETPRACFEKAHDVTITGGVTVYTVRRVTYGYRNTPRAIVIIARALSVQRRCVTSA